MDKRETGEVKKEFSCQAHTHLGRGGKCFVGPARLMSTLTLDNVDKLAMEGIH